MDSKDHESNIINLISDDDREDQNHVSRKKTSGFVNLVTDDEDSGNEVALSGRRSPQPSDNMESHKENKGRAALYHSACATAGCKNTAVSSQVNEAFCSKCQITRKYEAARSAVNQKKNATEDSVRRPSSVATYNLKTLSGTAVHSPFTKNGVRKATRDRLPEQESLQATSSKPLVRSDLTSKGSRQPHHVVPTSQSKSSANFGMEDDSDSLPELSQIRPAKKARLTKDLPVTPSTSLRAQSSRSTNHVTKRLAIAPSASKDTIRSMSASAGHLVKAGSSKGMSNLATNSTVGSSASAISQDGTPIETKKLEENLKRFPLLLENERIELVKSELQKNTSLRRREFVDDVSPFAKMKSIEVPGEGLEIVMTSLTASKKTTSIPFQDTRCLVQKVPPYKNFSFITRNILAPESKVLRFRRFNMFKDQKKSDRQREKEEHELYDLVIESGDHQMAVRMAEGYAALYKHLPAILESLNCTENAISVSAKTAFSRVFKSQGYDLQTLVQSFRKGTFDVADFLKNEEDGDESGSEGSHQEGAHNQSNASSYLEKATEPFSTYWTLSCPRCTRFQCGCDGEHDSSSGEIAADVSLVSHSKVLSKHRRIQAKPQIGINEVEVPCSDKCYKNVQGGKQTLWAAEDVEFLKALMSDNCNNPSFACAFAPALDKDCHDVHSHYVALGGEDKIINEVSSSPAVPRLPWYDNEKKVLLWKNPAEARETTTDTDVHRHDKMPKITPCAHDGPCSEDCHEKGLCNKFCLCDKDCPFRFTGCNCAETYGACSTYKCICRVLGFECDPDLCKSCGAVENCHPRNRRKKLEEGSCENVALQRAAVPAVAIGESTFEGWNYGLFALEDIKAGSFIGEYVGEVLTPEEAERRGIVYEEYFFTLNREQAIDATRMGNHMRFVNGTFTTDKLRNCEARILSVGGQHRIGFFAFKNIKAGHELFMDYGAGYEAKHKLHQGGKKLRKEAPKTWKLGNEGGQVAVILDDETPVPIVSRQQSSSVESSPPRASRRLVRGSKAKGKEAVFYSSDSDQSPRRKKSRTTGTPDQLPINKDSPAYQALSLSERRSLMAKARWAKEGPSGFGIDVGSTEKGATGSTLSSLPSSVNASSSVNAFPKDLVVLDSEESSSLSSFHGSDDDAEEEEEGDGEEEGEEEEEEEEDEEEEKVRPKRTRQAPLMFTRYYG